MIKEFDSYLSRCDVISHVMYGTREKINNKPRRYIYESYDTTWSISTNLTLK